MLIGAHVGVSAGLPQALEYAREVGAECAQIFAKSPRQWHARHIDVNIAEAFKAKRAELAFGPVVTHTAYLINLGTIDEALRERSVAALADELMRASLLGVDDVITHVGTSGGTTPDETAERIASAIGEAFNRAGHVTCGLLLENTAGAGTTFGNGPAELGAILRRLEGAALARVGVCIDTCHAHAAGIDIGGATAWTALMDELDAECGPGAVRAIHANDCLSERGSHRDRHAWIGDGTIGTEGFAAMLHEPRLAGIAAYTEMPGEVPEKDVENVSRLKALRDGRWGHA